MVPKSATPVTDMFVSKNHKIALSALVFDTTCTQGQIRPLSDEATQKKITFFRQVAPIGPMRDVLVWPTDATSMSQ